MKTTELGGNTALECEPAKVVLGSVPSCYALAVFTHFSIVSCSILLISDGLTPFSHFYWHTAILISPDAVNKLQVPEHRVCADFKCSF